MRFFVFVSTLAMASLTTAAFGQSAGQVNTETLRREHQISLDRKAGKITRDQEIEELKSARERNIAAHSKIARPKNSLGELNQQTLIREHQIAVERKEGKISRDEANTEARKARALDEAAHAKH